MTYEVYRYIFYGGAILAIIMFVVSLILFFVLKIPLVIGYFSGSTRRKAIEDIQLENEKGISRRKNRISPNKLSSPLTDKISPSGNLVHNPSGGLDNHYKTEKISTEKLVVEETIGETSILETGNETTVLSNIGETTLLDGITDGNETTVLSPDMIGSFVIEYEITYIHTEEVIV